LSYLEDLLGKNAVRVRVRVRVRVNPNPISRYSDSNPTTTPTPNPNPNLGKNASVTSMVKEYVKGLIQCERQLRVIARVNVTVQMRQY
jgi:hypothetical protein